MSAAVPYGCRLYTSGGMYPGTPTWEMRIDVVTDVVTDLVTDVVTDVVTAGSIQGSCECAPSARTGRWSLPLLCRHGAAAAQARDQSA